MDTDCPAETRATRGWLTWPEGPRLSGAAHGSGSVFVRVVLWLF
jgi:hypothetical protein